ncbi:adhesive plaque matrix protein-like [Daktulosphaira vitifoliae]|uniref:adhesive plaque matrix protein-like n=1 Tax=Daktulosphaira vitifoliae TaxID=58002 RepID=UPI0021A9E733|nr:adhesive plaque matrix protein-like [Daktulosphaira vitifoliae]
MFQFSVIFLISISVTFGENGVTNKDKRQSQPYAVESFSSLPLPSSTIVPNNNPRIPSNNNNYIPVCAAQIPAPYSFYPSNYNADTYIPQYPTPQTQFPSYQLQYPIYPPQYPTYPSQYTTYTNQYPTYPSQYPSYQPQYSGPIPYTYSYFNGQLGSTVNPLPNSNIAISSTKK